MLYWLEVYTLIILAVFAPLAVLYGVAGIVRLARAPIRFGIRRLHHVRPREVRKKKSRGERRCQQPHVP